MDNNDILEQTLSSVSTPILDQHTDEHIVFNPFKNLNEKQLEAFNEIKANIEKDLTDPEDIAFCNDMCYLRYLRARNYTVSKSEKMLRDTLEWRKKNRPQDIGLKDVKAIVETGCLYINSKDKKGRPIILARPRRDTIKNVGDIKFKNLVYWLETGFNSMEYSKGIETFCFVVDYYGFSSGNLDMKTNLESMHLLLDHCPERLGQAIFLDPPTLFWFAWKIISPFLNEVTMAKVKFIYSKKDKDGKRVFPDLLEIISPENLEKDLGGDLDYEFNYDKYLEAHPDPIIHEKKGTASEESESASQTLNDTVISKKDLKELEKKEKKEKKELEKKEKKEKKLEKKEKKEKKETIVQTNEDEID